jgi:hypothetical protein
VGKDEIGIDRQGTRCRRHNLVSTGPMRAEATTQTKRIDIARIGLGPYRDALECFLEIAGHVAVVRVFDEKSFPVRGALPELIRAGRALNR